MRCKEFLHFIIELMFSVMFFLSLDVLFYSFKFGMGYCESAISVTPAEFAGGPLLLIDVLAAVSFDFLCYLRNRNCRVQYNQKMDMVRHHNARKQMRLMVSDDARNVSEDVVPFFFRMNEKSVLWCKNQMQIKPGVAVGHNNLTLLQNIDGVTLTGFMISFGCLTALTCRVNLFRPNGLKYQNFVVVAEF